MPANLENSAVATGLEKSVFIPIPKKGNAKEFSNYCIIALISHTSKIMLKILQAVNSSPAFSSLQQFMNCELSDVQACSRKCKGTRAQIGSQFDDDPTSIGSSKKQESSRKKHLLLLY